MTRQECATFGCDNLAMWHPIEVANRVAGSARRCTHCTDAITEAVAELERAGYEIARKTDR